MDDYKIETIITALMAGIGMLWHQLLKQIGINRTDQKEFSAILSKNIEAIIKSNELMKDIKELLKDEQDKQKLN